jgi:hypothetical protein
MTYSTITYTRTAEGLVESHHDLEEAELEAAVYIVEASDNKGASYAGNALRFVSVDDAKTWAAGLAMRWFGCTDIRVVRATPPVGIDAERPYAYDVVEVVYQTLSSTL